MPAQVRSSITARAFAVGALALVIACVAWSYADDGIFAVLLRGDKSAEEKVAALRAYFAQYGAAAPLAYVAMVLVEVIVAPLPGLMLYAPGGVIFGGFWGGLLSLTGNVLGAGIACLLMRVVLGDRVASYFERSELARYEQLISSRGGWIVFLLRVNPLTSSDLVSYAAGLTQLPVVTLMLGTLAGMAPLRFAQAYLAEGLLTAFPRLIYPLILACAAYAVIAIWALRKLLRRRR